MYFPPKIAESISIDVKVAQFHAHLLEGIETDMHSGIVVDAEEVELVFDRDFDQYLLAQGELHFQLPSQKGISEGVVIEIFRQLCERSVQRVPAAPRGQGGHIVGYTYHRFRVGFVYYVVSLCMTNENVLQS